MSLAFQINVISIFLDIIIVASILYIGVSPKIKSSLTTKIGATLLSLFYLYAIIAIYHIIIGNPFNNFTPHFIIFSTSFFICSFLLFVWGINIWLPVKIVLSLLPLTSVVGIVADCNWINFMELGLFHDDYIYQIYLSNYYKIQTVISVISIISLFTSLLLVIIRWRKEHSRLRSKKRIENFYAKFPRPTQTPMAKSSKIVTKIPHKDLQ